MGLVAPQHVGSSWPKDTTCVPYIGRWLLIHCATRKSCILFFGFFFFFPSEDTSNRTVRLELNPKGKSWQTLSRWQYISHQKLWDLQERTPCFCMSNNAIFRQWYNCIRILGTWTWSPYQKLVTHEPVKPWCLRAAVNVIVHCQLLIIAPSRMHSGLRSTESVP